MERTPQTHPLAVQAARRIVARRYAWLLSNYTDDASRAAWHEASRDYRSLTGHRHPQGA